MANITSDSPLFQRGERTSQVEELNIDESKTETRFLPRSVQLTLPGHVTRKFPAGLQEIPVALLDDPWLKANGMVEYRATQGVLPPQQPMAPLGSHAYATAYAASGTYDATMIPDPYVTDEILKSADANARAAADNVRFAQENLDNAVRIHQGAVAALNDARAARERADEQGRQVTDENTALTGGSSQVTPSQRKALDKIREDGGKDAELENDRKANEARIGIDKLDKKDRAAFDAMSPVDKAKYIKSSEEERAVMLAAARK
jgi:hypothetical protein